MFLSILFLVSCTLAATLASQTSTMAKVISPGGKRLHKRQLSRKRKERYWNTGKMIGKGGFGKVYLGRDTERNIDVAIKVFKASESGIQSQENEVKLLGKGGPLNSDYTVKLLDVVESRKGIKLSSSNAISWAPKGPRVRVPGPKLS